MSLVSPRSFTARCYTQFKLLSDQGANIHHSELALAVFTSGLLYKRQIKNTSFYFIATPCIFCRFHIFFLLLSIRHQPHPPTLPPYGQSPSLVNSKGAWMSCNQRATIVLLQKVRVGKEKNVHLTWFSGSFMSDGQSFKESPFSINCLEQFNVGKWMSMRRRVSTTRPLHRNWHKWIPRECANEEEEKEKEVVDKVVGSRCGEAL